MDNTAYHITNKSNLKSILEKGLIPMIGSRSTKCECGKAIYMFPSIPSLEDAVDSWLLDEFTNEEELVVLEIIVEGLSLISEVEWELISLEPIDASRIKESKITI